MKVIALIAVTCVFTQGLWAQPVPEVPTSSSSSELQNVLPRFQSLQSMLSNVYEQTSECTELSDANMPKNCAFTNFCSILSTNVDKPYLYVNEQGGKIPNMHLFSADILASNCVAQIKNRDALNKNNNSMMLNYAAILKRSQVARLELLRTVREQNWQSEFVRFEESVAQIGLEQTELTGMTPPTEEGMLKMIDKAEAASGVKLPAGIREKYLASMTSFLPDSKEKAAVLRLASNNPYLNLPLVFDSNVAGSVDAVKENQKRLQASYDKSAAIFSQTKKDIIRVLEARLQANPGMATNVEAMKRRIETIAFAAPPNNPMLMNMTCPGPNAFYMPNTHSFTLCPQILELPETALKTIIAHELGHSIDPCSLSQPLKKIVDAVPRQVMTPEQMKAGEEFLKSQGNYMLNIQVPQTEDKYVVDFFGMAQQGLQQGLSSFRLEDSGAAVSSQDHPFSSVVQCLTTSDSIGARASDKEGVRAQLERSVAMLRSTGANDADPRVLQLTNTLSNLDNLYNTIGACSFLPGNTQLQEAFSDWIAGEVVGNDLKNMPAEKRRQNAFESFSFFTGMECNMGTPAVSPSVQQFVEQSGCMATNNKTFNDVTTIMQNSAQNQDTHNHGVERVERLFVAQPEVRSALGCEGKGATHCE